LLATQAVRPFLGGTPQLGNELAEVAVAIAISGKHDEGERGVALHKELTSNEQTHSVFLSRLVRTHDACHRTFIGDGQGRVPQLLGALDQLLRATGATEEREAREAPKLGVVGKCSHFACLSRE